MPRDAATRRKNELLYTLNSQILRGCKLKRQRLATGFFIALVCACAMGQKAPETTRTTGQAIRQAEEANPLSVPPRDWAADAVANELNALHHRGSYLRYRMHIVDAKGDQVRDVIESKDGAVARLILKNGKPLTADEDKDERKRLTDMLSSPSDYAKHVKHEQEGKKLADQLMRMMPDAMIYSYAPGQPQTGTNHSALEVVLDYKPNPKFSPPTTAAEALTGLEGRVWIDAKSHAIVRMEGRVFRAVNFGWGMLAHIYPGGKLVLEQTQVGSNRWIFKNFIEQISVRALMVKTININTNIEGSDFQVLPEPLSYQQAIRILLDTPLPSH